MQEKCSSLRRPLSAGYPISQPNSIARQKGDLGLLQDSNLNASTPCSVCGSHSSISPPSSLPFLPVSIPSDQLSPSSSVQTPPITVSGGNWIYISPCGHSFCPHCWTKIASHKLDKQLALDKCPVR